MGRSALAPWMLHSKPVVAIVGWIALLTVSGSESNIDHLSPGHIVQAVSRFDPHCELPHEMLDGFTNHAGPVRGVHVVAVQLEEKPVRSSLNCNTRFNPQLQTPQGRRIRTRQCTVFNSWKKST